MVRSPKWPVTDISKPIDLGLDRVFEALERLGNPQRIIPPVIHVAGTNGKGSTIAFIRAILEAAGKKCHVYTSPHLMEFNERIVLAGKTINDTMLDEVIEETKNKCEDINLTFFEGTTVAAFLAFSKVRADYVLLETGMGGRLDATNVIDKPLMTIITPISLDHTEFLGVTLERIAAEKAGIMKAGVDCIISKQDENVLNVLEEIANEKNAKLDVINEDFFFQANSDNSFIYRDENGGTGYPKPALRGKHQSLNAVVAVRAAVKIGIDKRHIKTGIKSAEWKARLQKLDETVFLDGGHNADAAIIIRDFIIEENEKKKKHNIAVVGILKTKDAENFIKNISPAFAEIFVAKIPEHDDSYDAAELKKLCDKIGVKCKAFDDFDEAYSTASNGAAAINNRVMVCGSLYLAGYVLGKIR